MTKQSVSYWIQPTAKKFENPDIRHIAHHRMSLEKCLAITSASEDAKLAITEVIRLLDEKDRAPWREFERTISVTLQDCEAKIQSILDAGEQQNVAPVVAPVVAPAATLPNPPVPAGNPVNPPGGVMATADAIVRTTVDAVMGETPVTQIHPTFTNNPEPIAAQAAAITPADVPESPNGPLAPPVDTPTVEMQTCPAAETPVAIPVETAVVPPVEAPDVPSIDAPIAPATSDRQLIAKGLSPYVESALGRFLMALHMPTVSWDDTQFILKNSLVQHARIAISVDCDITIVQHDATDSVMVSGGHLVDDDVKVDYKHDFISVIAGNTELRIARNGNNVFVKRYVSGNIVNVIDI